MNVLLRVKKMPAELLPLIGAGRNSARLFRDFDLGRGRFKIYKVQLSR
jgi:hypothetical protein